MRTYKHEALKEMREAGELDTEFYERIKNDRAQIKKQDVVPRMFPTACDDITYPQQALKKNLVYMTSNQQYGATMPCEADMPTKYFPRPENFTGTFNGGMYIDTGLNTWKTKSKTHAALDQ